MPDPLLYLQAMGAAAIVSAVCVLVIAAVRRGTTTTWRHAGCSVGIGMGLVIGYSVMSLRLSWPPANGLERLLTVVVPVAFGIELTAGIPRIPQWMVWLIRLLLVAIIPRILLHGSVYLSRTDDGWNLSQTLTTFAVCFLLLAGAWVLLSCLSRRTPGLSIPLALCLALQCTGTTVMLAGYIKGGAAALPMVVTLAATSLASVLVCKRSGNMIEFGTSPIVGMGVVGLFGLLFIGHFFGRVSTGRAVVIMLAPVLCWATELPILRHRKPLTVGLFRLTLVAIPLVWVLVLAKRDFDRDMAPLLNQSRDTGAQAVAAVWDGS